MKNYIKKTKLMQKNIKSPFKYAKFNDGKFESWELECFRIVDNPTQFKDSSLPDGEYIIRGNKKHYRKEYWKYQNKWYFIQKITTDNHAFIVHLAKFNLVPSLPEKEWQLLFKCKNKLSKRWQKLCYAKQHQMELRKMWIDTYKDVYKVLSK